jgi:hypothetical protein
MAILTASELSEASKCIKCLEPGELQYVNTYLLALIAGVSTNPTTLLEASKCLDCLTPGQLRQIQVYLLNRFNNL